jgi:RNA polymerase sigma-70 factor, ECF subfamily
MSRSDQTTERQRARAAETFQQQGADPAPEWVTAEAALLAAFRQAHPKLSYTLLALLRSDPDVQDTLQSAFLKCWQSRADVAGVRNVRAWVWQVAVNAACDLLRSPWRRRAKPLGAAPDAAWDRGASPLERLTDREDRERLRVAVSALRPAERAVFLLRRDSTLTYAQIAAGLGLPVVTARTLMHKAVRKLRRALQGAQDAVPVGIA